MELNHESHSRKGRQPSERVDRAGSQRREVVIASREKQSVRLVPCPTEEGRPSFGSAKGLLKMSDDFDEPLPDFDSYMR